VKKRSISEVKELGVTMILRDKRKCNTGLKFVPQANANRKFMPLSKRERSSEPSSISSRKTSSRFITGKSGIPKILCLSNTSLSATRT
jgi:hypothetical protein